MNTSLVKLIALLVVPLLMGQACNPLGSLGGGRGPVDGGVWRSVDRGETWEQRGFIREQEGQPITLDSRDANIIKFHPTDSRRLYLSSSAGIYTTNNAGEVWTKIREGGMVTELTPDPGNPDVIYLGTSNRIIKTENNGTDWDEIYVEARGARIQQIAVDILDSTRVYAGMNTGDIIVSTDSGRSWRSLTTIKGTITKIVMSPYDSNVIFVGTAKNGISASFDRGSTWRDLSEFYKEYNGSMEFKDLTYDETRNGSLLFASKFGLLWTQDSGRSWSPVNLVTPEGSVSISNLALNTRNPREIYYTTGSLLSRTFDGGENWNVQKLPSVRQPTGLLVDFYNPDNMYLIVKQAKK